MATPGGYIPLASDAAAGADYGSVAVNSPAADRKSGISISFHSPAGSPTPAYKKTVTNSWEHPGMGQTLQLKPSTQELETAAHELQQSAPHKLGQWLATSICGNDITASILYTTGLCTFDAGVLAPVAFLLVAATLYLFRRVYGESVTALPLNGGAYNVLLNTTSKSTASLAACLTILSYMATGVVSAASAIEYAQNLWSGIPVMVFTLALLALFALLNLFGIKDSATVAVSIFAIHLITLSAVTLAAVVYMAQHGLTFIADNWYAPEQSSVGRALFFGFSSAMLGVSGFETSSNFVEEQKPGVFVLTLRNMWAICAFFNPILSFLCVSLLPLSELAGPRKNDPIAALGGVAGGQWLEKWVAADAVLVLSGSVLTAYVGVVGLCRRLAMDRVLPQFLLAENRCRRTNHYIILGFFGVCSSMYLVLNGKVESLANVYTVSFLSVMGLFALGNMMLKYKRHALYREVESSWPGTVMAMVMVVIALIGTFVKDYEILAVFALYFVIVALLMSVMFFRQQVLKLVLYFLRKCDCSQRCQDAVAQQIRQLSSQSIAFFVKKGELSVMNKGVLYVRQNEDCACIRVIHVYEDEALIPPNLARNIAILDEEYPKIKIDLVLVPGKFGPDMITYLSKTLEIPKNLMFITCPNKGDFTHKLDTLGGVRLVTH